MKKSVIKKVIYTRHAQKKFHDLAELDIFVTIRQINKIIKKPITIDIVSDYPNKIASGKLDRVHVLRVVYREQNDIIIIITFYPGRRERYI